MKDRFIFIWDFHGTLESGNVNAVQQLVNLVLEESGIDKRISIQDAKNWYGLSWFDYFKLAIPDGNERLWQQLVLKVTSLQQRGWDIIEQNIQPKEYAREVLKTIHDQGHTNILLSNTHQDHIKRFTDVLEITPYFELLLGADNHDSSNGRDIKEIKKDIIGNFLRGQQYSKCIVIGDKESDILAGKTCGAITYLLIDNLVDKTKANHTITDLREVLKELSD